MKILIIRNYPTYVDITNNTYNIQEVGLAKALVRKGHTCDIIFWTDKKEKTVILSVNDKGKVNVFYKRGVTIFKNTIFTGCEDLFDQYDIIQPCEYNQMQAWLLAKRRPSQTIIYHGPYYSQFNKRYNLMCKFFDIFFLRTYIKKDTRFFVKSDLAKEFLVKKGVNFRNISTVGVGIDIEMLSGGDAEYTDSMYQTMKRDTSNLKMLYIGRFEKRRNIPFIIEVFEKILAYNKDSSLYMIGSGNRENMKNFFKLLENKSLNNKVYWKEKLEQKNISNIYKMTDFFLLPTEYEIFGMVILEAMNYGNIVITTKNGGSSTLIQNGKNGIICDNRNASIWAKKIVGILKNPTLKRKMQQEAAETIANKYTWDHLTNNFLEQYNIKLNSVR